MPAARCGSIRWCGRHRQESHEQDRSELREVGLGHVNVDLGETKALGEATYKGTAPELPGEIALVYATDANTPDVTAPARGVFSFEKKLDGRVAIVGGIFEGAFLDKEGMLQIATIPSMHVLRGMFVNVINSPIQGLVVALGQIAGKK